MKINKVIFSVDDNPIYADFWPLQAKLVKKIFKAEPILFYITDEDSDFYYDGNGIIKKINKNNCFNVPTSFQSQVVRMYATKYFPNEICLTADIDMLMLNENYFVKQIETIDSESLVIMDSKSYDLERIECQNHNESCKNRYPICYIVGKGKIFNKILNTDRSFEQYVDDLQKLELGWGTDELYFGDKVDNTDHGVNIIKLIRNWSTPWKAEKRIDRHNFPTTNLNSILKDAQKRDGVYDLDKLKSGYYIDAHCPRPYKDYKKEINELVDMVLSNTKNNMMYQLGEKYQNDKITHHRYDLIYPDFINHLCDKDIKMLEIGLGTYSDNTGYSRNMWKEYFPKSEIFVMDIHQEFEDEIGKVIKGDQSNILDLQKISELCMDLDFIVDDGSHHPEHQIKSFNYLFNKNLKKGGIYIIEDIECSYWKPNETVYGYETGYLNIINYFTKFLHELNSEFSGYNNSLNISQITFAKNCIIIKKQTEEEIELNKREYRFKHLI